MDMKYVETLKEILKKKGIREEIDATVTPDGRLTVKIPYGKERPYIYINAGFGGIIEKEPSPIRQIELGRIIKKIFDEYRIEVIDAYFGLD